MSVAAGTTVTWKNADAEPHTVTADDGSYDSGSLAPGATYTHTFTRPGTYTYYCKFHGGPGGIGMAGNVTVMGNGVANPVTASLTNTTASAPHVPNTGTGGYALSTFNDFSVLAIVATIAVLGYAYL